MLKRIINAICCFFGFAKPYYTPTMSKGEVQSNLYSLFKEKAAHIKYVKQITSNIKNVVSVNMPNSSVYAYKISGTENRVCLAVGVGSTLYKHCQYYGITNFNGFEIKPCKNE